MVVNSKILNEIINLVEKAAFKNMYSNVVSGKALFNPEKLEYFYGINFKQCFVVR